MKKFLTLFSIILSLPVFLNAQNVKTRIKKIGGFNKIYSMQNGISILPDAMGYVITKTGDQKDSVTQLLNVDSLNVFPHFPISLTGMPLAGGILCNMDSDPGLEILYNAGSKIHALNYDGSSVPGWPQSIENTGFQAEPAYGDIDGDGQPDVVAVSFGNTYAQLFAYDLNGELKPGFPVFLGNTTRSPVLCDLDLDNSCEIIVNKYTDPGEIYVYKGDGSVYPGWPQPLDMVPASSAAAGDITGDGIPEIVAESYDAIYVWEPDGTLLDGFPFILPSIESLTYSSPVLADVDGDGKREIIFGSHVMVPDYNGHVYILKNDGSIQPGWPKTTSYWVYSPPAVGYIDGDNILDISVGDAVASFYPIEKLYAWNADGNSLPGFPVGGLYAIQAQVIIADVDGDNNMDLITDDNSNDNGVGKYLAYDNTGNLLPGWPVYIQGTSNLITPALGDVNNDGKLDILGGGTQLAQYPKTFVYLWDTGIPYNPRNITIPVLQYNVRHDGVFVDPDVIPVELTSFKAVKNGEKVNLTWTTSTETNNKGFVVQRSVNIDSSKETSSRGIRIKSETEWQEIGFVNGAGTTTKPKSYSFKDDMINIGTCKYRLKQIDLNGKFNYSNVLKVNNNFPERFYLSHNYPNPFNPSTTIRWQSPFGSHQTLKIYDMLGREVATLVNEYKPAGKYQIEFNAANIPSGIYFYRLQAGTFVSTKKMILIK